MSKTERLFHPRTLVIHPDFKNLEEFIVSIPERFQRNEGTVIHQGRNELRKMEYNGKEYVIKSFHSPHLINRFVYGIFRPSKAKRSYDHAEMLLKIGVGTPQPVGYMNIRSGLLFDKSYYLKKVPNLLKSVLVSSIVNWEQQRVNSLILSNVRD